MEWIIRCKMHTDGHTYIEKYGLPDSPTAGEVKEREKTRLKTGSSIFHNIFASLLCRHVLNLFIAAMFMFNSHSSARS